MAYGTNAPFGMKALYSLDGGTWVEKLTTYEIPSGYDISIFTGDMVILSTTPARANQIELYLPTYTQANGAVTFTQSNSVLGVFQGCEYIDATTKLPTFSKYYPANTLIVPGTTIKAYINDDPSVVWEIQVSTTINANGAGAFPNNAGSTAAPLFPGRSGTAANTSGIGSNYSIMGGGGVNFSTIQVDPTRPQLGFYTNNPTSTITANNGGTTTTGFGNNPFGGNVLTGISGAYLCVSTYGTNATLANATNIFTGVGTYSAAADYNHTVATLPLKVLGYSPNSQNIPLPDKTLAQTPFVNVMVMINNHVFKPGTAGQTFA